MLAPEIPQGPEGAQNLQEHPQNPLSTLDLSLLQSVPEGSLGLEYLGFLEVDGVSPDTRVSICFAEEEKLAYAVQGCCEVDDVLHILLGMIGIKCFEAGPTGPPMRILVLRTHLPPCSELAHAQSLHVLFSELIPWVQGLMSPQYLPAVLRAVRDSPAGGAGHRSSPETHPGPELLRTEGGISLATPCVLRDIGAPSAAFVFSL